jgi:hypothetical protein
MKRVAILGLLILFSLAACAAPADENSVEVTVFKSPT